MATGTAVIYHYFEKDSMYRDNLTYFLSTAIHAQADYYIIISGKCSLTLPHFDNVKYIYTENINNDFGRKYFSPGSGQVRGSKRPPYR